MECYPYHEALGIVAFNEQQLELMSEDEDKLNHLQRGQIFLPPDVFLEARTHCSDHVVEVHDDMDERI